MEEISAKFISAMQEIENDQEKYWNSLSKDDQLKAFCAVVRRIHKGDVELKGSYRYVLYQIFGFGPESYIQAQDAGYLTIHNSIFDADHDDKLLTEFCKKYNIDDMENKIKDFWL